MTVKTARLLLIALAIVLYLPWCLWIWIGGCVDRHAQRKNGSKSEAR